MCDGLGVNEEKSRVKVEIPRTGIKGRQSFLGLFYLLDSLFQVFACLFHISYSRFNI